MENVRTHPAEVASSGKLSSPCRACYGWGREVPTALHSRTLALALLIKKPKPTRIDPPTGAKKINGKAGKTGLGMGRSQDGSRGPSGSKGRHGSGTGMCGRRQLGDSNRHCHSAQELEEWLFLLAGLEVWSTLWQGWGEGAQESLSI